MSNLKKIYEFLLDFFKKIYEFLLDFSNILLDISKIYEFLLDFLKNPIMLNFVFFFRLLEMNYRIFQSIQKITKYTKFLEYSIKF